MNTRLQVEHPITEQVVGLDLAQWQIRVAAGEPLPFEQADLRQRGHAIECRLYAEDPANRFLPATGKLIRFVEPKGPGIRVDTGVTTGDEVSVYYDPLIAKLIAHGEDRDAAIRRILAALRDTVLLGVTTNWRFLQDVLTHRAFIEGKIDTAWIDREFGAWEAPQCDLPPEVLIAAALAEAQILHAGGAKVVPGVTEAAAGDRFSPWRAPNAFRVGEG
jgi:acetyl/propionyl-CoA carboxylase alpha subunit